MAAGVWRVSSRRCQLFEPGLDVPTEYPDTPYLQDTALTSKFLDGKPPSTGASLLENRENNGYSCALRCGEGKVGGGKHYSRSFESHRARCHGPYTDR